MGSSAVVCSELDGALDALGDADLSGMTAVALGEQLVALSAALARLEGQWLRRLERFDWAGGAAADGACQVSCVSGHRLILVLVEYFGDEDGLVAFGARPSGAEFAGEQVAVFTAALEHPLTALAAFVDGPGH